MNGSVHGLQAHKQTSTNELLNPIASSAIDHQPSSYHYGPSATYTHPSMLPPRQGVTNGTAYNTAGWDGQRVDHMTSPRDFTTGAVHSQGGYRDHLSRIHGDRFSEPPAWSNPAQRMDVPLVYPIPPISRSSYSDERTSIPNDLSSTAGSSPYPYIPSSATYNCPELPPFAYYQWPPQPTAVFGVCGAHLVTAHPFGNLLGGWPYHARSPSISATYSLTGCPQLPHLPLPPHLSHPAFYSPIPHPSMPYPHPAPQVETKKGAVKRGGKKRGGKRRRAAERRREEEMDGEGGREGSDGEDKNGEVNDNGGVDGKW